MFNVNVRVLPPRLVHTIPLLLRTYAAPARNVRDTSDPRVEIMKRALYPPTLDRKQDTSPTGLHRSDVNTLLDVAVPSAEAHETITRAWLLYQRQQRDARDADMGRKFDSMLAALDELKMCDEKLYRLAVYKPNMRKLSPEERDAMKGLKSSAARRAIEARNESLFPRELRIPTDTPSRKGWDHNWTPSE
ncbi:hypothetical protein DACRYDRAFT_90110 [Dacryopinax primogenitus]|uniref:Large ribosomal subunit protein mL40 n=1 Tax=Dacryopinax primogenitus (strain DJM 731) TaxID=1858805 RepID=M5G2H7_DACPD|nr:uncharacterized protein DACRYDRAFT_90110 [Dacryopinax primogenitus]EJU00062.1 hypothetical protein DACRYDRAFT_90110 [Dacryopinax primogenitus]